MVEPGTGGGGERSGSAGAGSRSGATPPSSALSGEPEPTPLPGLVALPLLSGGAPSCCAPAALPRGAGGAYGCGPHPSASASPSHNPRSFPIAGRKKQAAYRDRLQEFQGLGRADRGLESPVGDRCSLLRLLEVLDAPLD